MKPIPLWIVTFVLGAAGALLTGVLGVFVGGLFAALTLALAISGDRWAVVSGLLTGFGATWLVLLARASGPGGQLDDAAPWIVLGAVPLAFGLVFLAIGIVRRRPAEIRLTVTSATQPTSASAPESAACWSDGWVRQLRGFGTSSRAEPRRGGRSGCA